MAAAKLVDMNYLFDISNNIQNIYWYYNSDDGIYI